MKRLCASGCSRPEHPDVESRKMGVFLNISACFPLFSCLFSQKKVSYVDEITFLQMYIDMFPSVFETIPAICFNVRESDTSVT